MTVVAVVPDPASAPLVLAWTRDLREPDETVEVLCIETGTEDVTVAAVEQTVVESWPQAPTITAIHGSTPVGEILAHLDRVDARLLVTPPFKLPTEDDGDQTSKDLAETAPCQSFVLMSGSKRPSDGMRILFVGTGDVHDRPAVHLIDTLIDKRQAHVTLGMIEDETGAEAGRAGRTWVQAMLHDAGLDEGRFEIKIAVDRLKPRGIRSLVDNHDVLVIGWNGTRYLRPLRQSLGETCTVALKRRPPLRRRNLSDWVPQMNPSDHADLRLNLRIGSQWGADFVVMLALASAIASLGLLQNSPAVVIGSMLLAPLMTPMIGLGLAMAQASPQFARQCGTSIGLGMLLTLAVSTTIGLVTPTGETLTQEVLARGEPHILDLLIAVFAAGAATFAMARPNIVGAAAGVAIATALVPPLCSVGIALASAEWLTALGALPWINGDARAIRQILVNIISNALKFTPESGAVEISTNDEGEAGVSVRVRDTGIGIPADSIDTVFQPFVQVADICTRSHAGTGLGLSIVRALVDLHGGTVRLTSEPGVGTEVIVRFPRGWSGPDQRSIQSDRISP